MLRASSYNIYIDLPDDTDGMLMVHGYTGAYDKVSRKVAAYVRSLENHELPNPLYGKWSDEQLGKTSCEVLINDELRAPSDETIKVLKRRGYLTEKNSQEEQASFVKLAKMLHAHSRKPNYILMPTYNCNLRCSYCFQDHMRTNSDYSHLLRTMKIEMVDRIFAAMAKIESHHGYTGDTPPPRHIGLFGGEPLIKNGRACVEHIINKAQSLGAATFFAVSNGTDLHHYEDLLGPTKLSYLQITLDGPAREHDQRRIYPNGKGSFEQIARNITLALERGVQISVRMNIDRLNAPLLPELADEIIARGWDKYPTFGAYTAPIHAANTNVQIKTTFDSYELDQKIDEMREVFPNMSVVGRPDDRMKESARRIFNNNGAPSLRSTFCGAHNGMYIFDAFGDIYACWERTGDKKIRIGSLNGDDDFTLDDDLNDMWRSRNVTTNPTCQRCRYALHCGGGCAVFADRKHGTMFTNFCDAFGKRFNTTAAEAYLEHVGGAQFVDKADRACDL